jgi:dTDP-glucose pyrophosphorylase
MSLQDPLRSAAAIERCCVLVGAPFRSALERLDACSTLYVVDDARRVLGSVDNDCARRALLRGQLLDAPIRLELCDASVAFVDETTSRANAVEVMSARGLEQIAVLTEDRRLVAVHFRRAMAGNRRDDVRAVIMAGGRGSRLFPLTEHTPKPMLPVAGRPILERLVLHLVGFGITEIYLAINYLGTKIEQHFGDGSSLGCRIRYLREQRPLGTGGALALLEDAPSCATLMLNGDLVTQIDLPAMLAAHRAGGHVATMGVRRYAVAVPFGVVDVDQGRIRGFREKPSLEYLVNAGVYVLEPAAVQLVPHDTEFPITSLFERCLSDGRSVGAHTLEEDWIDVGQLESLLRARSGV